MARGNVNMSRGKYYKPNHVLTNKRKQCFMMDVKRKKENIKIMKRFHDGSKMNHKIILVKKNQIKYRK